MTDWAAPDRRAELWGRRVQYETDGLDVAGVDPDPVVQWDRWHQNALEGGVAEPNAMTVATVDADGVPDARIVLVRQADQQGLVFYTNYDGAKSRQLDRAPVAAAVFSWLDLHRQVRLRAHVERVTDAESDAYFASRPVRLAARRVGVAAERGDRRSGRPRGAGDRLRRAVRRP